MVVKKRMMSSSPTQETAQHDQNGVPLAKLPLHPRGGEHGQPIIERSGSESSTSSAESMLWAQANKSYNTSPRSRSSTSLTSSSTHSHHSGYRIGGGGGGSAPNSPQWSRPSSPSDSPGDDSDDLNSHPSAAEWSPPYPDRRTKTYIPIPTSPRGGGPSSSHICTAPSTPWFVMVAFALVASYAVYTMRSTVLDATKGVSQLRATRDQMADQFSKTEQRLLKLKREVSAIDAMANNIPGHATTSNTAPGSKSQRLLREVTDLQDRLKSEKDLVEHLKETVQNAGKTAVLEKYGDGVQRVEVDLVFPDRQIGPHRFVIELAPVDVMPHSVHTFLEMVSAGLLDGCSFILNALHVVKAAPLPYDGSSAADKAKAFTSHGLESVSFKEYSDQYPHTQYTVGFAADGSPSFYINTQDNSEIHAGDPCFGKIVEGIDAIKRLEAQPTRNGIWFQKRIGIKSARLITNNSKNQASKTT